MPSDFMQISTFIAIINFIIGVSAIVSIVILSQTISIISNRIDIANQRMDILERMIKNDKL